MALGWGFRVTSQSPKCFNICEGGSPPSTNRVQLLHVTIRVHRQSSAAVGSFASVRVGRRCNVCDAHQLAVQNGGVFVRGQRRGRRSPIWPWPSCGGAAPEESPRFSWVAASQPLLSFSLGASGSQPSSWPGAPALFLVRSSRRLCIRSCRARGSMLSRPSARPARASPDHRERLLLSYPDPPVSSPSHPPLLILPTPASPSATP